MIGYVCVFILGGICGVWTLALAMMAGREQPRTHSYHTDSQAWELAQNPSSVTAHQSWQEA